jgi:hypothetical protein
MKSSDRNLPIAHNCVAYIGLWRYFQLTSLPTGNSKNFDRVVRRKSEHGVVSRPLAMRSIVLMPGPWIPRSRSLINVLIQPAICLVLPLESSERLGQTPFLRQSEVEFVSAVSPCRRVSCSDVGHRPRVSYRQSAYRR